MSRTSPLNSPLLLGFEEVERILDRVAKGSGDGYPPYNIERLANGEGGDVLRITLAVAGFTRDQLDVSVEDSQLTIRGKQDDDDEGRVYLHRGIAARQFTRAFVLADGIEVRSADLNSGLLSIELERPEPERLVRKVEISQRD
jgi:HSP20 family molecular chaperone IbpA